MRMMSVASLVTPPLLLLLLPLLLLLLPPPSFGSGDSETNDSPWRWECVDSNCVKKRSDGGTAASRDEAMSLSVCRLFCAPHANLWPRPSGGVEVGSQVLRLNPNSIDVVLKSGDGRSAELVAEAGRRFRKILEPLAAGAKAGGGGGGGGGGRSLVVTFDLKDPDRTQLTLDTDEGYELNVTEGADGRAMADIVADNYFGARHGLETLSQLIVLDELRHELVVVRRARVVDTPAYRYRGLLLDTSRNYFSVASIKRTIDGMAMNKLNTFHWHVTDSHSFPLVSRSNPQLARLGAYSPLKVYTPEDVRSVVEYGRARGVRVLPEFDAPAHVGEGWQDTDFVACFRAQPWSKYCVEPPCGQFDPTKEGLYDALEGIYADMYETFEPDMFHMGGDEVSLGCWESTDSIVRWMRERKGWQPVEQDFMKLWGMFQERALERLDKVAAAARRPAPPIVMWTSTMTQPAYVERYLPKDRYIIQVWTTGNDSVVRDLLAKDYRLIMSNYDALYLDCGLAGWVTDGNNWCSPYIGWQKVYDNSPLAVAAGGDAGKRPNLLGAEAALWSEQADETTLDSALWPRASAMAERLWAEPANTWRQAENRILVQRERMVAAGLQASALEPEWCLQHQGECPIAPVAPAA